MSEEFKHPAFPQPEDLGVKLWRYLDFEKADWLLKHNRLFMPSADRLGDQLEGTQPTGDVKWWQHLAENAESDDQRTIVNSNREFILKFSKMARLNYYVSCWHMNSSENKEMWRRYTKSAESLAIRTTYRQLQGLLPNYVFMGMVRYIDYAKERLPSPNLLEYITHKNVCYSYEREVRAVASPPATEQHGLTHFQENLFELNASPDFRFYSPSIEIKSLVQEIVLHPDATLQFEEKVKGICAEKGLAPPRRSNYWNPK